ncbi:unnamed protein product [Vicia faba]|uniref:Uncharacterized protein n=1 Tax=Vicia faba TaxID=3906 RepID=A0AAV1AUX2_VICFA|nr:unnamed protein product [Vicia faba]
MIRAMLRDVFGDDRGQVTKEYKDFSFKLAMHFTSKGGKKGCIFSPKHLNNGAWSMKILSESTRMPKYDLNTLKSLDAEVPLDLNLLLNLNAQLQMHNLMLGLDAQHQLCNLNAQHQPHNMMLILDAQHQPRNLMLSLSAQLQLFNPEVQHELRNLKLNLDTQVQL